MPPKSDIITSLQNPLVKKAIALKLKKNRDETGCFLAEGLRSCILAVKSAIHPVEQVIFDDSQIHQNADIKDLEKTARAKKIQICYVNHTVMKKLSGRDNPPPAAAIVRQHYVPCAELLANMKKCVVVLDNVRDPGNLGTIIRTADALAIDGVVILEPACDPYSIECVRATMDSIFHLPVAKISAKDFIDACKTHKRRIIGTALEQSIDFRKIDYAQPFCLLMGSEQNGLPQDLIGACDQVAKLPISGRAESLNLAVAAGIMLYAALEPWKK